MKTILAILACIGEFIIFSLIEAEFFYEKLSVFWKSFFMVILFAIMTFTWKAIMGQKKEKNIENDNNSHKTKSIDDQEGMSSKTMKNKKSVITTILYLWSFLNFSLFLIAYGYNVTVVKTSLFFPFTYDVNNSLHSEYFDIKFYDYTELFFYVGIAWLAYLLLRPETITKLKIGIAKNKDKLIIVSLCTWSFIHVYLFLTSLGTKLNDGYKIYSQKEQFYPFTFVEQRDLIAKNFDLRFYDYTELFIYVVGAWMIYFLFKYLKNTPTVIQVREEVK